MAISEESAVVLDKIAAWARRASELYFDGLRLQAAARACGFAAEVVANGTVVRGKAKSDDMLIAKQTLDDTLAEFDKTNGKKIQNLLLVSALG